jgi:hypothetical protein
MNMRLRCLTCCAQWGAVCDDLLSLRMYLRPWIRRLWVQPQGSRPKTEEWSVASPCCRTGWRSIAQCWRFASQYGSVAMWRQYTATARSIWQREVAVGEEMCLFPSLQLRDEKEILHFSLCRINFIYGPYWVNRYGCELSSPTLEERM